MVRKSIQLVFLACLCCAAPVRPQQDLEKADSPRSSGASTSGVNDQYLIGIGDELSVGIFGKAQLSRNQRVDSRGMIRMPLIEDDIRAACRTENELAEEIGRLYRDRQLLRNPAVSVSITDYQSQPVAVLGAVNTPGRFLLRRRVRLLELLVFHAGGPSLKAGRKVQILSTATAVSCAQSDNQTVSLNAQNQNSANPGTAGDSIVVTYDLKELMEGHASLNPYVQQGDVINVPAADEALIVGNVVHPSAVTFIESTTLARALALVGGILPNSKRDKIRITRPIPGTPDTTEFLVDLKDKDKSKGEGFLLQGGDIVEVPTQTGFKAIANGFMKSLTQPGGLPLPLQIIR